MSYIFSNTASLGQKRKELPKRDSIYPARQLRYVYCYFNFIFEMYIISRFNGSGIGTLHEMLGVFFRHEKRTAKELRIFSVP